MNARTHAHVTHWPLILEVDQGRALEWGLSMTDVIVYCSLRDFWSWGALSHIEHAGAHYVEAPCGLLLARSPLALRSRSAASRALQRLERKGLIHGLRIGGRRYVSLTPKGSCWATYC